MSRYLATFCVIAVAWFGNASLVHAAADNWKFGLNANWENGGAWSDGSTPGNLDSATLGFARAALTNLNVYKSSNGLSDSGLVPLGDLNGDGTVNNLDVQGLINLLKNGGGSLSAVPEPASIWLIASGFIAVGGVSLRRRRADVAH